METPIQWTGTTAKCPPFWSCSACYFCIFFSSGGVVAGLIRARTITNQPPRDWEPYVVPLEFFITILTLLLLFIRILILPYLSKHLVLEYLVCSNTRFSLPQAPEWGAILHQRITLATRHVTLIWHYMGSINTRKCFWFVQALQRIITNSDGDGIRTRNLLCRSRGCYHYSTGSPPWVLPY